VLHCTMRNMAHVHTQTACLGRTETDVKSIKWNSQPWSNDAEMAQTAWQAATQQVFRLTKVFITVKSSVKLHALC
jgi:hypothetical protein